MSEDLTQEELRKIKFHPENNENVISIVKMPDGNYRGFMQKNGKLHQVRQGDPNTVLNLLLTAE